jgi:hypothetical protein
MPNRQNHQNYYVAFFVKIKDNSVIANTKTVLPAGKICQFLGVQHGVDGKRIKSQFFQNSNLFSFRQRVYIVMRLLC